MPSNGATSNVVHRDLGLYSQGHEFWNVNISKTVRASEQCSGETFIVVDICNRMIPFPMLYSVSLTTFSRSSFSNDYLMQTLLLPSDKLDIWYRMAPLRMLSIVTLTYIFKVTWISLKPWELEKMLKEDFYRGWYFPSNGTISNVLLRGFDLFLQGKIFQLQISRKLSELAKNESYGFYRFWYLPLNGAISKVADCEVGLKVRYSKY